MPQLDKPSFFHQLIVVTFFFLLLHIFLSLFFLPELFSSIYTRKLFLISSGKDIFGFFKNKYKNLKIRTHIFTIVSDIHEGYYNFIFSSGEEVFLETSFYKDLDNFISKAFSDEIMLVKMDALSLKTLL